MVATRQPFLLAKVNKLFLKIVCTFNKSLDYVLYLRIAASVSFGADGHSVRG